MKEDTSVTRDLRNPSTPVKGHSPLRLTAMLHACTIRLESREEICVNSAYSLPKHSAGCRVHAYCEMYAMAGVSKGAQCCPLCPIPSPVCSYFSSQSALLFTLRLTFYE